MPTTTTSAAATKPMTPVKMVGLLVAIVLVAVGVALTYFYFEAVVRNSINYIWTTWLNTDTRRLLVVPTAFVLGLVFFWTQHSLDPASETNESKGLGAAPTATVHNFVQILGIGFLSLVAGASLGPEAVLVPACIVLGAYVGASFLKTNADAPKLLGMVGFVALLAAFFDSFIAGMLGLLLVTKQVHIKVNVMLVVVAAIASAVTVLVLSVLESKAYAKLPPSDWHIGLTGIAVLVVLVGAGYAADYGLLGLHRLVAPIRSALAKRPWWNRWLVASAGLSVLYLIGGPLVEFTGNESIVPMLQQAAKLGLVGLVWVLVIKLAAITWSKSLSYRGGMVFPTVFVASVVVAIAQLYDPHLSFTLGLIAVMVGAIAADQKAKIML